VRAPPAANDDIDFRHDAPSLGRTKTARVIVPTGSPPGNRKRTCYLLHAFGGSRLAWPHHLDLSAADPGADLLFVFPESGRRWFINDCMGRRYEDYLVDDLVPAIDAEFPTDRRSGSRIVGGFSMGAATAVYLSLRHPDVFSSSFSYAGAFYASRREGDPYSDLRPNGCMMPTEEEHNRVWGPPGSSVRSAYDPDRLIADAVRRGATPEIIIEVGIGDHPRVVEQNRRMHAALAAAGIAHEYLELPGDHSWASAAASARRCLRKLAGA
jgi:S-formylglutathione hydrolase FrmB